MKVLWLLMREVDISFMIFYIELISHEYICYENTSYTK